MNEELNRFKLSRNREWKNRVKEESSSFVKVIYDAFGVHNEEEWEKLEREEPARFKEMLFQINSIISIHSSEVDNDVFREEILEIIHYLRTTVDKIEQNNIESAKEAKKDRRRSWISDVIGLIVAFTFPILLWILFGIG